MLIYAYKMILVAPGLTLWGQKLVFVIFKSTEYILFFTYKYQKHSVQNYLSIGINIALKLHK